MIQLLHVLYYIPFSDIPKWDIAYSLGNDTIDRYPLCASGALKILCITPSVWSEIDKTFAAFRRWVKEPPPRKVLAQDIRPQAKAIAKNECQTAYEPTLAIRCNDAEHRRWVRVKEWFNDYAATDNYHPEKENGHIIELLRS